MKLFLVEIKWREGEHNIRLEDVLAKIEEARWRVNFWSLTGNTTINALTTTTAAAQSRRHVGWIRYHAGNCKARITHRNGDSASWQLANTRIQGQETGCFVSHESANHNNKVSPMAGWCNDRQRTDLRWSKLFDPVHGADGWQVLPILSLLAPYLYQWLCLMK
jgi:kynureninase